MADETTKGIPFPEATDPNDIPADLGALAEAVDARLVQGMTEAERDALEGATRWTGRAIWNSDSDQLEVWDGAEWKPAGSAASVEVEDVAGDTYTVVAGDAGKVLRFTEAALVTVTLPDGLAVGTLVGLLSAGAGGLSVVSGASSTVQPHDPGTVDQHGEASALVVAENLWSVQGTEDGS